MSGRPTRLLLMNQFFWPDAAPTGQLLTDLARALAAEGYHVTVICGRTAYARSEEPIEEEPPPVEIFRLTATPFTRGKVGRLFSYMTFFARALWRAVRLPKPDLVLTLTTPPLLSTLGAVLKKFRGSRHFIWEMDLYPDVAVDLGVLRAGSIAERAVSLLADYTRRQADGVVAPGECMRQRLERRGVPVTKLHVVENWVDGTAIRPLPFRCDGRLRVLYSGNLGLAHDIDTIGGAIFRLKDDERFQFFFCGGGAQHGKLLGLCRAHKLRNTLFLPYRSRESLSQFLGQADIGLVTQNPACVGSIVPSKVYGLMAAGRPVLFIGPRNATPARIVERCQCGWQVDVGDVEGLVRLLRELVDLPAEVHRAGQRAREAFDQDYDLALGVARLQEVLGLSRTVQAYQPGGVADALSGSSPANS